MATEEMINEVHALVSASVMAERDRILSGLWALLIETRKDRDTTDNPAREARLAGNCMGIEDAIAVVEGTNNG